MKTKILPAARLDLGFAQRIHGDADAAGVVVDACTEQLTTLQDAAAGERRGRVIADRLADADRRIVQ